MQFRFSPLVWLDGMIIARNYVLQTVVMLGYNWWLCMVINISVHHVTFYLLTRWDVSSIPGNGIFLTKN